MDQGEFKAAVHALRCWLDCRLECFGGYPAVMDTETFPDHIVIANCDEEGRPSLQIIEKRSLLSLYREAQEFLNNQPDFDILGAMSECDNASILGG